MEKTGSVYLERQNVDLQKDTFFFFPETDEGHFHVLLFIIRPTELKTKL